MRIEQLKRGLKVTDSTDIMLTQYEIHGYTLNPKNAQVWLKDSNGNIIPTALYRALERYVVM